jgi:uncharacterized membrane protein YbhN (UPF0104 family)
MDFLLDFNPGDHAWLERIFWVTQAALVLVAIIAARLAARNRSRRRRSARAGAPMNATDRRRAARGRCLPVRIMRSRNSKGADDGRPHKEHE